VNFHIYIYICIIVVGKQTKREPDRLCSDNKAGGRDGKVEREKLKHEEGHIALGE
jgi:hypothetical protein